jgi:uncharacterized membrane protein
MTINKTTIPLNLRRLFSLRAEWERLLVMSMGFSCLLVCARILYTKRLTFDFLVWNLFLAFLPYLLTRTMALKPNWVQGRTAFFISLIVWLFFIPNSFYILTDLFHLNDHYNDRRAAPWFDLLMIVSFAWNGLVLGIGSVFQMERLIRKRFTIPTGLAFVYPLMWLIALGVYIGRYMRYNSWSTITHPFNLIIDIGEMLFRPFEFRDAWGMILGFSLMLSLMYLMLTKMGKMQW